MKTTWLTIICLAFLLFPRTLFSQTIETIIEEFEENQVPELEELLRTLVPKPIRINKIPADSLSALWFLDAGQIEALLVLHESFSPNISITQISEAIHLPEEIVEILFSTGRPLQLDFAFRNRTIKKQTGWQQSLRFDVKTEAFSAGYLIEKDPGEPRLDDFTTGYATFKPFGENSLVILGHFSIQNSVGLVFAGPYGLPVLSQPARAVSSFTPRTLPYRTTSENIAFRGGVVMYEFSKFQILAMQSFSKRDARFNEKNVVTSRPVDGIHVTASQRATRKALGESNTGFILTSSPKQKIQIGISLLTQRFNHTIQSDDTVRQRFAFRGKSNHFAGVNINYPAPGRRFSFISEAAFSKKGRAFVFGINFHFNKAKLTSAYWFADPEFQNTYGALPGNRVGKTDNGKTFYSGLESRSKIGKILIYTSRTATPWRTFLAPQPVSREEFGLQWERRLRTSTFLLAKFRFRSNSDYIFDDAQPLQPPGKIAGEENLFTWRLQFRTRLFHRVNYRVRLDGTVYKSSRENETGNAQMHEIIFRNSSITAGLRYTYFSTGSFASRIYQFEYSLPGLLLPSTLFGTGERLFGYFRWKYSKAILFSTFVRYTKRTDMKKDFNFGLQMELSRF
jgi:hypothetical protein